MSYSQMFLVFAVLAPGAAFGLLALSWLAGWVPSERAVARITGITFSSSILALAAMGWSKETVAFGNWFTVHDYHFPLVLMSDRLSLPFLGMTAMLAGLIGKFSVTYLHREPGFFRFFLLLHLFAFGSLLAFAAGSFDLLIAGWEIVGITSVLLIAFFQRRTAPVENALRVYGIYRACDIGLLVAVFAMHNWAGSASFNAGLPALTGSRATAVCLLLLLAAAGKAAQVPFSGWLPRAMEGPTPSSAIFYGAISIHAGAYLLLRVQPMLAQSMLASVMVGAIGIATAIYGTMCGRASADAKTSLAYASLTQVGVVFVEIALGWSTIAVFHIMGHAMVRTLQFLRAPSMLHDYHQMQSSVGGELAPTGAHLARLLPPRVQLWLYRWALDRGHLDTLLDRAVIHPLTQLSKLFARLDGMGYPMTMLTATAIGVPWLGAIVAVASRRHARVIGFCAAAFSTAAGALLLHLAPAGQSFNETLMLLYSCLTLGSMLVVPRRDCTSGTVAGILFVLGATLLAYSSDDVRVLLAGWILSIAPYLSAKWFGSGTWRPKLALLVSSAALAVAIALMAIHGDTMSIAGLRGHSPGGMVVFGLLVVAVVFRKGICPAHAWVADAAQSGPAIPTVLLFNGHFGAMLMAKLIVPLFPNTSRDLFPLLSYLALITALYIAIRALNENSPRRLLAFLSLSQSACILAGLESRTVEGVTGALVHWFVVTASTVGLFAILRLLEVRFGENLTAGSYLGLAEHAPRLAVFFIVFGLALVGLPGTLSFCSQDLLINGTLASHPQTGLLLPIATAMNAVSVFRLFARLFLGKRRTGFTSMADALPRERWALTAGVLFVVIGGLFPNAIVARQAADAESVEQAIYAPEGIPAAP